MAYYNDARTHLSLNKDAPVPRAVQAIWRILPTPILGRITPSLRSDLISDKDNGVAGNLRALIEVYQGVERYWRRMLCSRSRDGGRLTWGTFNQIKEWNPLLRPKLRLPHRELQALAVL